MKRTLFQTFTAQQIADLIGGHVASKQAPGYRGEALTTLDMQFANGELSMVTVSVEINEEED
jgi:hypothetical protein